MATLHEKFEDYPSITTGAVWLAVTVQVLASYKWDWVPDLHVLSRAAEASATYAAFAGVSALVGGFAGVVLVFAMSPGWERFARMRVAGRERLEANWLSPVISAFGSAFLSVFGAIAALQAHPRIGLWLFEVAVFMAFHAAARQAWLLRKLMKSVRRSDEDSFRPPPADIEEVALGVDSPNGP